METNTKSNTKNIETKKYITLTYINRHTDKIAKHFTKAGYNIVFRTKNKLINKISLKPHTNNSQPPRCIQNKLLRLWQVYIGQTGRSFTQRYTEHIQAIYRNTAFANHITETGHTYSNIKDNLEILHTQNKGHLLNTLEQFEIYIHPKIHTKNILNEQLPYKSHTPFDTLHEPRNNRCRPCYYSDHHNSGRYGNQFLMMDQ